MWSEKAGGGRTIARDHRGRGYRGDKEISTGKGTTQIIKYRAVES